ncbi:MAG TPA: SH3 domain-containing protein [Anaerolineales bacterium]|nr:SH3 domain-containing protein [Anaerolineales bacterium]
MSHNLKSLLAGTVLLLAALACNGPFTNAQQPTDAEIQTAAAETLQAIFTPSDSTPTQQSATEVPTDIAPGATATPTGAVTRTPTYSVPMLTVIEQTNCRSGPGQDYEILFTYLPGKELEILGRYDPDNYWLVKAEESPTGNCWLWGEYVELSGSFSAVSSVTPPPTSTQAPPQAPSIQEWEFSCSGGILTFTVSWIDKSSNETGYRIFRNGEAVAEIPANSSTYTDSFARLAGENAEYYLQAFSPFGTANSSVMRMTC